MRTKNPIDVFLKLFISLNAEADWTGIEKRLAEDPAAIASIADKVEQLDRLLAGANLTNAERVQAGAAVDALKSLVRAPQPEWKAIAVILAGPTVTALCNFKEIAEVIGAIIGLFVGLGKVRNERQLTSAGKRQFSGSHSLKAESDCLKRPSTRSRRARARRPGTKRYRAAEPRM